MAFTPAKLDRMPAKQRQALLKAGFRLSSHALEPSQMELSSSHTPIRRSGLEVVPGSSGSGASRVLGCVSNCRGTNGSE